jgi:hypothetical protein
MMTRCPVCSRPVKRRGWLICFLYGFASRPRGWCLVHQGEPPNDA